MQGVFILGVYILLLAAGLVRPFVMGLGYVWVDLFRPGDVYPTIMGSFPAAFIIGAGTIGCYLLFDRKHPPRPSLTMWLIIAFAAWMTLVCTWAAVPDMAWLKWDWAFKTVAFTAAIPFLFRSRVQIEAYVLVIILALCGEIVPQGIKTIITGGGYGMEFGLTQSNTGLGEGATLATYATAIIPLILFVTRHSSILPWARPRRIVGIGLCLTCVVAALGTFERTGLVALAVLACLFILKSRRKILFASVIVGVAAAAVPILGSEWFTRMHTIGDDPTDTSTQVRLAVWRWTLDYVHDHPLGGGFDLYRIDTVVLPSATPDGQPTIHHGWAFHSMYFEILGETGVIGFALWLGLICAFYWNLMKIRRRIVGPEAAWLKDLVGMSSISMTVQLAGGAFIGVGFLPLLYYMIGLGTCLREYQRHSEKANAASLANRALRVERSRTSRRRLQPAP